MQQRDFALLVTSIRQAGRIRAGTLVPARVTILISPRLNGRDSRATALRDLPSKRKV